MADMNSKERLEANRQEMQRLAEASAAMLAEIEANKKRHAEYSRKMNTE